MELCVNNDKISKLKAEIKELKQKLHSKEQQLSRELKNECTYTTFNNFSTEEIVKYSRQMIVPEVGVEGQVALKHSKVLVVGVGGLGCPAAEYLVRAGVGEITLVDYDEVELTNLQRQILYTESDVGVPKVESACNTLKKMNSNVKIIALRIHANSDTLKDITTKTKYDVIVDGSDNVATRYLLNDVCVLNDIPLVSGSALQTEGQLTVYHYQGGPCYRCLFPVPPPPETVTSCGDGGVLGPVPGVVGVLQALETIKILTGSPGVLSRRLLLINGADAKFQNVKLRSRNPACAVCGDQPSIKSLIDYEQFCGSKAHDKIEDINVLGTEEQIDVEVFERIRQGSIVLDVRPVNEFCMCSLSDTYNFPMSKLQKEDWAADIEKLVKRCDATELQKVYVLCRRGNDSQRAILEFRNKFEGRSVTFCNVKGGLHAYAKKVDSSFPIY